MQPSPTSLPLATAFAVVLVMVTGCGPQGPMGIFPGGPLAGDAVSEPVADWRFTDDDVTVAIETRGEWLDHSVTVLAMAVGPHLYVPSRQGYRKRWVQNVLRDPRVRIGVDGRIYPGRATRVTDQAEADAVARAELRKYVGVEADEVHALLDRPAEGDDHIEVWLFRVESTGATE